MPRTEPELDDDRAAKAKEILRRLRADAGSAAKVATALTKMTGRKISGQSIQRWTGKGRPALQAWRLLVDAKYVTDDDVQMPVKRLRRAELEPDDVAELKALAKRLSRIAALL